MNGAADAPVELLEALAAVNQLRVAGDDAAALERLEAELEVRYRASHRLVVYGSLAPGREHHAQLAGLGGAWTAGWVTGTLHASGWGAATGYPALEWSAAGRRVAAQLFSSPALPQHWNRLDAFEGAAYRRILVPFYGEAGFHAVGNLYAVRPDAGARAGAR